MKRKAPKSEPAHVWNKRQLSLLGKISDGALARQLGLSTSAVFLKRSSMGIPSSRPFGSIGWGPREIALLGKHPDAEVARRLGIPYKSVIKKRLALGIECHARSSNSWHRWTARELALLGTNFDRVVAEEIGISSMCVTTKRREMGIPSFLKRKSTNRPRRSVGDWTAAEMAILGTMTDKEAGEALDLSPSTVRLKRISLGIPPCRRGKSRPASVWTPDVIRRLGKESAAVIARDVGVSRQRVSQKLQELGIPPFVSK